MTNEKLDQARADEAKRILAKDHPDLVAHLAACLAREGWMPPEPVDPDIAEADELWKQWQFSTYKDGLALAGIKRGRALAAAEAKPGMVWVKHDGSDKCPVASKAAWIIIRYIELSVGYGSVKAEGNLDWRNVTHYAVITPPAEDMA